VPTLLVALLPPVPGAPAVAVEPRVAPPELVWPPVPWDMPEPDVVHPRRRAPSTPETSRNLASRTVRVAPIVVNVIAGLLL
jgi:hypothetical protein